MSAPTIAAIDLPTPPDGSPAWQLCVYAHTHWDREWYQPFERFRMQLVGAVDRILDVLEADPAFTTYVLDGQTIVLDDYLQVRPDRRERLGRLIAAGRIEVGPWYILPDEFLVSGESLVRNLLEGRRGAARFGEPVQVGYLPDPFGHVAQMPQVLRGFGIDSIVFSRGMGDEWAELGNEFRWQAPDGASEVLALNQTGVWGTNGYCNAEWLSQSHDAGDPRIAEVSTALAAHLAAHANTNVLLFAAGCDHETVNPQLPAIITRLRGLLGDGAEPRIAGLGAMVGAVHDSVAARAALDGYELPVFAGELRGSRHAPILEAIFSARVPLKQDNVRLQALLERCIEPLTALTHAAGGWHVPEAFLQHAWRLVLQNQPHDSIGGCSVDATHDDMPPRTKQAHDLLQGVVEDLQVALGAETEAHVFNPEPFAAGGLVTDIDGAPAWVGALPPLALVPLASAAGAAVGGGDTPHGVRVVDNRTIASDVIEVAAAADGSVRVALLGAGGTPTIEVVDALRLVDVADAGDEYDFGLLAGDRELVATLEGATTRLAAPGVAELELRHRIVLPVGLDAARAARSEELADTVITTVLRVAGDQPWVDCTTSFDNRACDHRLRVRTALPEGAVPAAVTVADGHFAMVERPVVPVAPQVAWRQDPVAASYCEGAAVLPAGDGAGGVAIYTRGLHEYEPALVDANGCAGALEVTLVRSVGWLSRDDIHGRPQHAGPELATPGSQCLGPLVLEYAIAPFAGTWEEAGIAGAARRFARPPLVLAPIEPELRAHSGQQARERDILNAAGGAPAPGLLAAPGVSIAGAELSALKLADDESGDIVLRVFNPRRSAARVRIDWPLPLRAACHARLDEQPLDSLPADAGGWDLELPAAGIATLRLRTARQALGLAGQIPGSPSTKLH